MRFQQFASVIPALAIGLGACAKPVPVDNPAPVTAAPVAAAGSLRWSASLNPVQERTAEIRQSNTNRARGQFTLTEGDQAGWSRASLSFSANTNAAASSSVAWAIVPGSCGTDAAPVMPVSAFPLIELGGGGSGVVNTQIHFAFPLTGTYHVNVYRAGGTMNSGSTSIAGVLACGNMKLQR